MFAHVHMEKGTSPKLFRASLTTEWLLHISMLHIQSADIKVIIQLIFFYFLSGYKVILEFLFPLEGF